MTGMRFPVSTSNMGEKKPESTAIDLKGTKKSANLPAGGDPENNKTRAITTVTPDGDAVFNNMEHQVFMGKNGEIIVGDRVGGSSSPVIKPNFEIKDGQLIRHIPQPDGTFKIKVDVMPPYQAFELDDGTIVHVHTYKDPMSGKWASDVTIVNVPTTEQMKNGGGGGFGYGIQVHLDGSGNAFTEEDVSGSLGDGKNLKETYCDRRSTYGEYSERIKELGGDGNFNSHRIMTKNTIPTFCVANVTNTAGALYKKDKHDENGWKDDGWGHESGSESLEPWDRDLRGGQMSFENGKDLTGKNNALYLYVDSFLVEAKTPTTYSLDKQPIAPALGDDAEGGEDADADGTKPKGAAGATTPPTAAETQAKEARRREKLNQTSISRADAYHRAMDNAGPHPGSLTGLLK